MKHILKVLDKKLEKLSEKNKGLRLSNDSWARQHYDDLKKVKGLEEEKRVLMMEIERLNAVVSDLADRNIETNEKLCN